MCVFYVLKICLKWVKMLMQVTETLTDKSFYKIFSGIPFCVSPLPHSQSSAQVILFCSQTRDNNVKLKLLLLFNAALCNGLEITTACPNLLHISKYGWTCFLTVHSFGHKSTPSMINSHRNFFSYCTQELKPKVKFGLRVVPLLVLAFWFQQRKY